VDRIVLNAIFQSTATLPVQQCVPLSADRKADSD